MMGNFAVKAVDSTPTLLNYSFVDNPSLSTFSAQGLLTPSVHGPLLVSGRFEKKQAWTHCAWGGCFQRGVLEEGLHTGRDG